ncbi:imidazolonepropionase [Paenibacillus beijingensis]|uniref:Imidazolonepropionase n=1 Tax=Paenibacillus beijingensis TaxID=1126833 RepID=A0A0D5NEJ7_9BACL|nr:imidazolonepropionase [Paenibacillus beijingensis]AJY73397.1 imidazolonepropionase [Paenibacillus beijingensis]
MKTVIYVKSAEQVLTVKGASLAPKKGKEMSELGIIEHGSVIIEDDRISFVGPDLEATQYLDSLEGPVTTIDASGKVVTPGLVDPHTHLVFAGSREKEFEMRLQGVKYIDILKQGGGILSSTRSTREATLEELVEQSLVRLNRLLEHGVTTVEAKSGYGLTTEDELKQLEAARKLNDIHPVDIVSTFMGAHAVPAEYKEQPDQYVKLVIEEMIPRAATQGLAEFCDVFCEEGVFTVEQSERILEAGKKHGLKPKIHADEIVQLGGAELAAKVGAVSAEHLLQASDEGIRALAQSGTIAVLLPATAFFLMEKPARARKMIEEGVAIALSTDCNPGSSPTQSMPFVMNAACLTMKMTPAEVLTAATINAAHAIGRADQIGSIEVGKKADLVLFEASNYQKLQYNFAVNLVDTVIKNGKIAVQGGVVLGNQAASN